MGRNWLVMVFALGALAVFAQAEPNEKALRYHKLLLRRPDSAVTFERFVDAWLDTGSKEELQKFLERPTKGVDATVVDWRLLARFLEFGGQDEDALEALNAAVTIAPKDEALRLSRAKLKARLLDFEGALADLDVVGDSVREGDDASLRGLYLARSGRPEDAVAAWKEILKARPKDEELREDLIELEVAEGLYAEALETMEGLLAITKDPYHRALRKLRQGDILLVEGSREKALEVFEGVLGSSGESSWLEREALAQVERVFVREDDVEGLRAFYAKLREAFPRRVSLRIGLARQMAANGEGEESIALFREVLLITPGDQGNRELFIDLLESLEKWEEASRELKVLLGQRNEAALWQRLAGFEAQRENEAGVKEALGKVLTLRQGEAPGVIQAARLFERYGLEERAEEILREGRTAFPNEGEVVEALAAMLVRRERGEEAVDLWQELARTAEGDRFLQVVRSLQAHGFGEDAFAVMQVRKDDFVGDVLFLTAYCQLGLQLGKQEEVWPSVVVLARRAEVPTSLESAIKIGLQVGRHEAGIELVEALEKSESLGERCLLAALFEQEGNEGRAGEILQAAAKKDEGALVAGQLVRLLEGRGEFEAAAKVMREVIAKPKGNRPLHLRRLVDIFSKAGDSEQALQEVENWKRLSPGDRQVWKKRAELLHQTGRRAEAVRELRRAVSKFGEDEDLRSALAAALVDAGEVREGERMYRRLYEEAESFASRQRWIGEMVSLARQEGREDELVEEFERRKRANPREVLPLLALATIYEGLKDARGQQQALVEAVRRRPKDVALISALATVAEKNGDQKEALRWHREAVKHDAGPDARRHLAEYHFRVGEVEEGLALLSEGLVAGQDPRALEPTLQLLIRSGEWQLLLDTLAQVGDFSSDWRLQFVQGIALEEVGRLEEAQALFLALLEEDQVLPGVSPNSRREEFEQYAETFRDVEEMQFERYQELAYGYREYQLSMSLPGDLRELHWMALAHLEQIALGDAADDSEQWVMRRRALAELLGETSFKAARRVFLEEEVLVNEFQVALEENPGDAALLAEAVHWVGDADEFAEEWLTKAEASLQGRWQRAGQQARRLLIMRRAGASGDLIEGLLAETAEADAETKAWIYETVADQVYSGGATHEVPVEKVAQHLTTYLAGVKDDYWENNWAWVSELLNYQLGQGQFDEAVSLMNRLTAYFHKKLVQRGGVSSPTHEGLHFPEFPPQSTFPVHCYFVELVEGEDESEDVLTARQIELLTKLGKEVPGVSQSVDLEALGKEVGKFEDPYLRFLMAWKCGQVELVEQELKVLLEGGELRALVLAAGYAKSEQEDSETAYRYLEQARKQARERGMRVILDGQLVALGSALAEENTEIDLAAARRAALRLRRNFRQQEDVQELATAMGALGMEEEMERLLNPRSTRVRLGGASPFASSLAAQKVGASLVRLMERNDPEGAALQGAKELRQAISRPGRRWRDEELVEVIAQLGLQKAVLAHLAPEEGVKGAAIRETYWEACLMLGEPELGLPVLRELAAERPTDKDLRNHLVQHVPAEEREELVLDLLKGGDLDGATRAYGTIVEAAGERGEEQMFASLELLAAFLENLEPSVAPERDLSFALYHGRRAFLEWNGDEVTLPTLVRDLKIPQSKLNSKDPAEIKEVKELRKRWDRRVKVATRLAKAMFRHPQLALPTFEFVHGYRAGLGWSHEQLLQDALGAMKLASTWNERGDQHLYPWTYYSDNEGTPPRLGLEAAVFVAHAAVTSDKVSEDVLEVVLKSDPHQPDVPKLIVATLKKDTATATEAMRSWLSQLPEDPQRRAGELAELLRVFLQILPPDEEPMKAVMAQALDPEVIKIFMVRNPRRCQTIARWVKRRRGMVGIEQLQSQWMEAVLGPPENWAVYAELLEDEVPVRFHELAHLKSLYEELLEQGVVSLDALVFVIRHGLVQVVELSYQDFQQGVRWQLYKKTEEEVIAELAGAGMFQKESFPIWGAMVDEEPVYETILETVHLANLGSYDSRRKIGKALVSLKGEGTFLKRMVGARLIRDDAAKRYVLDLVQEYAASLRQLPENELQGFGNMLRVWLPEMTIPNASAETLALLRALNEDRTLERLQRAQVWLTQGFEEEETSAEEVAAVLADVARRDGLLALQVWKKFLRGLQMPKEDDPFLNRGGHFREADGEDETETLLEAFSDVRVPHRQWIPFLEGLLDSKEGRSFDLRESQSGLDLLTCYAFCGLTPELDCASEHKVFWQRVHWSNLPKSVRENSARARAVAAYYFLSHQLTNGQLRESDRMLEWLKENSLRDEYPVFARVYHLIALIIRQESDWKEGQREEARKIAAELLEEPLVPARLRLMLAYRMWEQKEWLLLSEEGAVALCKTLTEYANDGRRVASEPVQFLLELVSGMDGPSEVEWAALAKSVVEGAFGAKAMRWFSNPAQRVKFARPLFLIAIKGRVAEVATRAARIGGESLRGDLDLLLAVTELGGGENLNRLLPDAGKVVKTEGLGVFGQTMENQWKKLQKLVPNERRYVLDCLVAARPDEKGWEGVSRAQRLKKLAQEYAERAPEARLPRVQCLGALATEDRVAELVRVPLEEEARQWRRLSGRAFGANLPEGIEEASANILLQAIRFSGLRGETDVLSRVVVPLAKEAGSSSEREEMMTPMERQIFLPLLQGLSRHPERAKAALPYVTSLLNECLTDQHGTDTVAQWAMLQAVWVHLLAGKEEDLKAFEDGLAGTAQQAFAFLKQWGYLSPPGGAKVRGRPVHHEDWSGKATAEVRQAYLRLTLETDSQLGAELRKRLMRALTAGTYHVDDLRIVLNKLPEGAPGWEQCRGMVGLLLSAAQEGDKELVAKLLPGLGDSINTSGLSYTAELGEELKVLLKLIEPARRYRFECSLARMAVDEKHTEATGETRISRTEELARRFAQEAPEGDERLECLSLLTLSPAAILLLRDEYLKAGELFEYEPAEFTPRREVERSLIGAAMELQLREGHFERIKERLAVLTRMKEEGKVARAAKDHRRFLQRVAQGYFAIMAEEPTEEHLAFACELIKGDGHGVVVTLLMGIGGHAMAGKGEEFTAFLEELPDPKKEWLSNFKKGLWVGAYRELAAVLGRQGEAQSKVRKALLRGLLTDLETLKREGGAGEILKPCLSFTGIPHGEVIEVVEGLPRNSSWLQAVLVSSNEMIKRRNQESAQRMLSLLEDAGDFGEAETGWALAYQTRMEMNRGAPLRKVWEMAQKVNTETLPEEDRKWFTTEFAKWKRAMSVAD